MSPQQEQHQTTTGAGPAADDRLALPSAESRAGGAAIATLAGVLDLLREAAMSVVPVGFYRRVNEAGWAVLNAHGSLSYVVRTYLELNLRIRESGVPGAQQHPVSNIVDAALRHATDRLDGACKGWFGVSSLPPNSVQWWAVDWNLSVFRSMSHAGKVQLVRVAAPTAEAVGKVTRELKQLQQCVESFLEPVKACARACSYLKSLTEQRDGRTYRSAEEDLCIEVVTMLINAISAEGIHARFAGAGSGTLTHVQMLEKLLSHFMAVGRCADEFQKSIELLAKAREQFRQTWQATPKTHLFFGAFQETLDLQNRQVADISTMDETEVKRMLDGFRAAVQSSLTNTEASWEARADAIRRELQSACKALTADTAASTKRRREQSDSLLITQHLAGLVAAFEEGAEQGAPLERMAQIGNEIMSRGGQEEETGPEVKAYNAYTIAHALVCKTFTEFADSRRWPFLKAHCVLDEANKAVAQRYADGLKPAATDLGEATGSYVRGLLNSEDATAVADLETGVRSAVQAFEETAQRLRSAEQGVPAAPHG